MDWESGKQWLKDCIVKYRYLLAVLAAGLLLLMLPEASEEPDAAPVQAETRQELQMQLEEILSAVSGVGKVQVLLTESAGKNTLYQMDESREQSDLDTVIVMNSQREELGLVKQILPPEYRGAVVVCQGADRAEVRLAVVEAVKSVTGLSSHRITVLKMK